MWRKGREGSLSQKNGEDAAIHPKLRNPSAKSLFQSITKGGETACRISRWPRKNYAGGKWPLAVFLEGEGVIGTMKRGGALASRRGIICRPRGRGCAGPCGRIFPTWKLQLPVGPDRCLWKNHEILGKDGG